MPDMISWKIARVNDRFGSRAASDWNKIGDLEAQESQTSAALSSGKASASVTEH